MVRTSCWILFGRKGISTEYGLHDERNVADDRGRGTKFRVSAKSGAV